MSYPYDLGDIYAFQQIARAGSISHAAAAGKTPKATLSLQLRRLEDALKVELFVRKARGLELTDAGREFLDNCGAIFDSCENAVSSAQRAHSLIRGRIRIASRTEFGTLLIGAAVHDFALANPEIDFELQLHPADKIIAGQVDFDCLIFIEDLPDSSFLRRKLGTISYGLYANPAFLKRTGIPERLEDVDGLDGVVCMRNGIREPWKLRNGSRGEEIRPYERFNVNEYWLAKYLVVAGSGLGYLPDFLVKHEVESGQLVPVLPQWRSEAISVYVIYAPQRHRNPRIMKFVDAMAAAFDAFMLNPPYGGFTNLPKQKAK